MFGSGPPDESGGWAAATLLWTAEVGEPVAQVATGAEHSLFLGRPPIDDGGAGRGPVAVYGSGGNRYAQLGGPPLPTVVWLPVRQKVIMGIPPA